jgi:hypothetical protein
MRSAMARSSPFERAMTLRRNRSISTKVTDAECEQIVVRANPKTVSKWARAILVHASEAIDIEFLLPAEFLALRTIAMNLHFALAEGGPVPSTEAKTGFARSPRRRWKGEDSDVRYSQTVSTWWVDGGRDHAVCQWSPLP